MAKKKNEEIEETTVETAEAAVTEEVAVEAAAADEPAPMAEDSAPVEEVAIEAAAEEVAAEEDAPPIETKPKKAAAPKVAKKEKAAAPAETEEKKKTGKRAEKVGIVSSDKMMKTVTVRVDRLVKHPIYRKYVKKRKKFMAHDETGAKIGDKVRIVETRPLSARKRWRVVEIIQKAQS
jgi:small subunit ribosomal protein S17